MTVPILSSIFSSQMMKITNKTKGLVVLVPMRTLKVSLRFPSRPMYHLMEDGNALVDQRVLLPVTIDVEFIAPSLDVLAQANDALLDRSSLYTVQSRGVIVDDMRVDYQGINQSPDLVSATPLKFQFTQLLYQGQANIVSAQSADSSVVDRGMAIIGAAKDSVTSVVSKVKSAFSSII